MNWKKWLIAFMVVTNSGYMIFDGAHAIITRDYVTPQSGPYAGQLGPWSKIVQAVGLDPHTFVVESLFIFEGMASLAALFCYLQRRKGAKAALAITNVLQLWYLPFGTISCIVVLVLLFIA
ncbi:MAG TPA: hypothetical protein VGN23_16095 [Verrucomicrobiae bacterium]|jgi:hypothetical protein